MERTKQELINDLAHAARIISNVDSDFVHHLNIYNDELVSIKNDLSGLLMSCISVRKRIESLIK